MTTINHWSNITIFITCAVTDAKSFWSILLSSDLSGLVQNDLVNRLKWEDQNTEVFLLFNNKVFKRVFIISCRHSPNIENYPHDSRLKKLKLKYGTTISLILCLNFLWLLILCFPKVYWYLILLHSLSLICYRNSYHDVVKRRW